MPIANCRLIKYLTAAFLFSTCREQMNFDQHLAVEGHTSSNAVNMHLMDAAACACKAGKKQSPIDIDDALTDSQLSEKVIQRTQKMVKLEHTGHTVLAKFSPAIGMIYNNLVYDILQFHFHTPAEHTFRKRVFPMEMHIVHKSKNGKFIVLSILFRVGKENAWLGRFWPILPGARKVVSKSIDMKLTDLTGQISHAFSYDGSFTTAPCTEGVRWFILKQPIEASVEQIDKLQKLEGNNARAVQEKNQRSIFTR